MYSQHPIVGPSRALCVVPIQSVSDFTPNDLHVSQTNLMRSRPHCPSKRLPPVYDCFPNTEGRDAATTVRIWSRRSALPCMVLRVVPAAMRCSARGCVSDNVVYGGYRIRKVRWCSVLRQAFRYRRAAMGYNYLPISEGNGMRGAIPPA